MNIVEWGVIALAAAFTLFWLGIMPKTQVILGFIGTCIVTTGLFGTLLAKGVVLVSNLTNALTAKIFGVAVPGLLVVVLGIIFVHDLMPKHSSGKRTFFIGITLAAALGAGLSTIPALNAIPANVRTGITTTTTSVNGG
jgi:hypothetical protein